MRLFLMGLLLLWLGGCASALSSGYGQGGMDSSGRSYETARADNRLSAAVTSALVRDREVSAMAIQVTTFNGVVTLRGTVPSAAMVRRAGQLAAGIAGVARVDNQLRVAR
ncbi:MAG: BON domain-containing protein [Gammaproteobacteria bacterium]|nr:BON domain-containing protein [Gammaproteobacteria bacterium]